ncbi:MAG TPA: ABC transporter ATP-binding protein [Devosia sp.]|jgi:oligopeptide/dipeptide ABC transporter ATP-binding protein|uniref:ABC transporter ATP-binding protein n=1 Tax=Devosia sp. TaxID=1871048 RepID=UPI002DDD6659|nr:ABC transporter ATP-binding protein [Devosia sp.]HEV2514043.1 ABC transporter ATP-binding protein [Devosia sp.]
MTAAPLLSVRDLTVSFNSRFTAVREASFDIHPGELVGVVGESGSGKSVSALAVMGLLPPTASVTGSIHFEGRNLLALPRRELRKLRGRDIGIIFQEPMTSLNPVFTIGDQIAEAIRVHSPMSKKAAWDRATELLEKVGVPAPRRRLLDYPHQLSGGLRQRVMIAIALSSSPKLLIADEPTTALDVTIQAQLLDLLNQLRQDFGTAILLITHNMGVMAEVADRVVVMYASRIVEQAGIFDLFDRPQHPYTSGLLGSTPELDGEARRLRTIAGAMPNPAELPPGCLFAPRCPKAIAACLDLQPPLLPITPLQSAACIRAPGLISEGAR